MSDTVMSWTGATGSPAPMTVVDPDRAATADDGLDGFAADSGLNGPFVAGALSAFTTHARNGIALFKMLGGTTTNPVFKTRFEQMADDASTANQTLEQLISDLGGNPHYVGHLARLTEGLDTKMVEAFLLTGSGGELELDTMALQATLLAWTAAVGHVQLLDQLASEMDSSQAQQRIAEVVGQLEGPARGNVQWTNETLSTVFLTMAQHPGAESATAKGEELMRKLRDKLRS